MMARLLTFQFAQPWWLLLLLLVPLAAWLRGRPGRTDGLPFSSVGLLRGLAGAIPRKRGRYRWAVADAALALLILAMACPRVERGNSEDRKEGIDIVLAVDTSGSMGAGIDYRNTRMSRSEALRLAINDFVDGRPNDRFGMIGFAYDTWLMSPLTLDGGWIKEVLENKQQYQSGFTGGGTAVGNGILSGVELLKNARGPSRILILATDGESNAGVAPLEAAEVARKADIRIYSLGLGMGGAASKFLKQIADRTGGAFFNVTSSAGLHEAYRQIDRLERSRFEQKKLRLYDELFPWFTGAALVLLLLEFTALHTVRMRIP